MKTVEKKFEHWLKTDAPLFRVESKMIVTPGEGITYHFGNEFYNEEEYRKIEAMRLKAYNFYIEKTSEERKEDIKHELSNSLYPKKLLKAKIEKLNEKIKPFEESIYLGHKNPEYITGYISTIILESNWFNYIDDYYEDDSVWPIIEESLQDDTLIHVWADYLLVYDLTDLLNKKYGNGGYGIHQDKKDWIRENWFKLREQMPSDRQADIKIQELYKESFNGLTISPRQIQRFTDR